MGFRFSIRTALVVLTVGAGFSLVLAQAVRGQEWAVGAAAAVVCLLAAPVFYAATYLLVRLAGLMLGEGPADREAGAAHPVEEAGPT